MGLFGMLITEIWIGKETRLKIPGMRILYDQYGKSKNREIPICQKPD